MKLYELTSEVQTAIELYNQCETDEQLADVEKKLVTLQGTFNDKCVGVAKHILNTESETSQIDAEIVRLSEIKKRREKQSDWFREYLKRAMESTNTLEIDGAVLKLKIVKNPPSVDVIDESLVPDTYKKTKMVVTIDKTAIKEATKSGIGVDGTRVIQTTRLSIK